MCQVLAQDWKNLIFPVIQSDIEISFTLIITFREVNISSNSLYADICVYTNYRNFPHIC